MVRWKEDGRRRFLEAQGENLGDARPTDNIALANCVVLVVRLNWGKEVLT